MVSYRPPKFLEDNFQVAFNGASTLILDNAEDVGNMLALLDKRDIDQITNILTEDPNGLSEQLNSISPAQRDDALTPNADPEHDGDFKTALRIAYKIWLAQGESRENIKLAIALPNGQNSGKEIEYLGFRPALALHSGSLRIRFTPRVKRLILFIRTLISFFSAANPWFKAVYALKCSTWLIAFILEPSQEPAVAIKELMRNEAAKTVAAGSGWPSLEDYNPADLENRKGIIILLHGVFSTDYGTFEGFRVAWENNTGKCNTQDYAIIGWPHDSLACIEENAEELSKLIVTRCGAVRCQLPIVFVCHSRGGLLARRTALALKHVNTYSGKIGCISFGTPHKGSQFADCGPEELAGILYLLAALPMIGMKKPIALFQVLRYYWGGGDFCGVENLKPPRGIGLFELGKQNFIDKLESLERAAHYRLSTYAVTGLWNPDKNKNSEILFSYVLRNLNRFFLDTPNDGLVTVSSARPNGYHGPEEPLPCMHTEYFNKDMTGKSAFYEAFEHLADFFEYGNIVIPPLPSYKQYYLVKNRSVYRVIKDGDRLELLINTPFEEFKTWQENGVWVGGWNDDNEVLPLEEPPDLNSLEVAE